MVITYERRSGEDFLPHSGSFKMHIAEAAFQQAYPTFESTSVLDELRVREYARLDEQQQVYLDYTGGGLYAESQLREHMELLCCSVFGNPHSTNPTSQATTELVEHVRNYVLTYFNASPDEYAVIFTTNASGALKLVGESYPFAPGGQYLLTFDNHNSVNGIREFAKAKGATFTYVPIVAPDLRVNQAQLIHALDQARPEYHNLFAYPAQSNFSGVQHPLQWIEEAHARGWDVLVDCAAFVPTNRLDLSKWHPDFVPISFYKMFGYPTGVGCLLVRKAALAKLQRPWFAGGTIRAASVQGEWHEMIEGQAAFEDGTINYLNLPAVAIGLRHLMAIGMEVIHERVRCLTSWLLDNLLSLYHSNGMPLVQVYGPHNDDRRGATIALNFLTPDGHIIDERVVDQRANKYKLSLRTGCFCNPGAAEAAFHVSEAVLLRLSKQIERMSWDQFLAEVGMQSRGAVRISPGLATTFADAYRCLQFAETFVDTFPMEHELPPR
jgi:selenocysteine lyase/cysteine desulfurase